MKALKGDAWRGAGNYDRAIMKLVIFPLIIMLFSGFSFFLGGYNCFKNSKDNFFLDSVQPDKNVILAPLQIKPVIFPECGLDYQDYTPCTDPKRWKKFPSYRLSFYERHCPPAFEKKECLVPPPNGYMLPIKWPDSRNQCWYRNVPYEWINKEKSNQHWLKKEGNKFIFPGGGTMFPDGVSSYVDLMEGLIPGMKDGTVRTAIDTGCGVASWGGNLLDRGILTVSLAPRDYHEAQVQFALERGIPAMLSIISTQRLPFPANSFDMAHCSRCLIPWTEFGGIYLAEIHRILRPGGFWVLSGPPVNYQNRWIWWNTTLNEQKSDLYRLENLLDGMCFKFYTRKDGIAVWQKASNNSCYGELKKSDNYPTICDDGTSPDAAWYVPLRPCISIPNPNYMRKGGLSLSSIPKWPARLQTRPKRGKPRNFKQDSSKWNRRVMHYKTLLPALGSVDIRNVMDMNTLYGGFAASLIGDPLWVMNVVSTYGAPTLGVVFDRGLIGTYHDWCEAFSTYPRTYDLLHVDSLFTEENHRFEMKHVMLEMDRILRPNGHAIICEYNYFMDAIATIAKGMRWYCKKHETKNNSKSLKILICQKKLWYSSQTNFTL